MAIAVKDVNILKQINVKSTVLTGSPGGALFTPKIQMKNFMKTVDFDGRNNEFI